MSFSINSLLKDEILLSQIAEVNLSGGKNEKLMASGVPQQDICECSN